MHFLALIMTERATIIHLNLTFDVRLIVRKLHLRWGGGVVGPEMGGGHKIAISRGP
ncbi:MAG: hypothetical protein Rhob2KO_17870 [Rhodopirellula baltica]